MLRNVYVAETNEQARAEAVNCAEDVPFWEFDFDLCQSEGLSIIGDPNTVIQELQAQSQTLGCGIIMGLFQFGSMPHELAMKNINLFAKEVLPEVQKN